MCNVNCKNCGAPLKLLEGHHYFYCEYCSALHFPEAESRDGVVVLGEGMRDIACPVCQIKLSRAVIDDVEVLHCTRCRGILTDQDSFLDIVRYRRSHASGPPDRPRRLNEADLAREVVCALCGEPMDTHPYYGPGNFVIDTCMRCRLVWLDHGEIDIITDAPGRDRRRAS